MRLHLFSLIPLLLISCSQPPSFQTPLIYDHADPWVYLRTDGMYYFTATVPEYDRLIIRGSDTIEGLSTADEKVIWEKYETGIMGSHIWAPELHYLDGKWYIYFAAGGAEDVLKAASWEKSAVPVFKSSDEHGVYGPGHNSFTTTKDGKYDLLVYHARSYKEIDGNPLRDPNRHMRVQILTCDEDGYPVFGEP
jgi:GH43 family beta-xylosidase